MYLQALEIEGNDEEALCNLGLVLSRLSYNDYAKLAFEEGININPGNKALIHNYLLFLLETKQLDKFKSILQHAKRVLDTQEILTLEKLYHDFSKILGGSALPQSSNEKKASPAGLKSALKSMFAKRISQSKVKMTIQEVDEEENKDEDY